LHDQKAFLIVPASSRHFADSLQPARVLPGGLSGFSTGFDEFCSPSCAKFTEIHEIPGYSPPDL